MDTSIVKRIQLIQTRHNNDPISVVRNRENTFCWQYSGNEFHPAKLQFYTVYHESELANRPKSIKYTSFQSGEFHIQRVR